MRRWLAILLLLLHGTAYAAYCRVSPGIGGNDTRQACSFYVVPTGGSDSNPGTAAAPFATLSKLRSAVAAGPGKVACLKAGSYTQTLGLTAADAGETWETDTAASVNAAVITGTGANVPVDISGSSVTWNAIRITSCGQMCLSTNGAGTGAGTISSVTIINSEIDHTNSNDGGAAADGLITVSNCTNCSVLNNYVHDGNDVGISVIAFNAPDRMTGTLVSGNVIDNVIGTLGDSGAIYTNARNSLAAGGGVTITNNYVRNYGNTTYTANPNGNDFQCIYLDDSTSGSTVSGNVCAPPTTGAPTSALHNNSAMVLVNGGSNNTITNNILDLGATSRQITALWSGANGNSFTKNIIISGFTGPLNTSASGVTGFAYYNGGGTVSNNAYTNFAGGSTFSNGTSIGDSSPQGYTTAQLALSCPGGIYTLNPGSAARGAPLNFAPVVGGFGPPGFTIPASTNHSC